MGVIVTLEIQDWEATGSEVFVDMRAGRRDIPDVTKAISAGFAVCIRSPGRNATSLADASCDAVVALGVVG